MSIINQKKEVFGNIAATKTLLEGLPELKLNPSFPSINNDTNSLNFLIDLLSSLVGLESLREVFIDILSTNLQSIETSIKQTLKRELNNIISCEINPSIPENFLNEGEGINLELRKVDFNNLFLTDPESDMGGLLYSDIESKLNSSDFNTFLYNVIQNEGTHTWDNCLDFKFIENGEVNNILNVKVSKGFSDSNKNLKDLNNEFVDSIKLFDVRTLLNKLFDDSLGSITFHQNKSKEQIIEEAKINKIIDDIINQNDEDEFDDSFFEFNNSDLTKLELEGDNKMKGIKKVVTSEAFEISASKDELLTLNDEFNNEPKIENGINNILSGMGENITSNIPKVDKYSVKLDFITDIVKKLMRAIGNIIISPKFIGILAINNQIIYNESFDNPMEYIKKNKYLIKNMLNGVRDAIIEEILNKVTKEIEDLALLSAKKHLNEQIKTTSATMSSLIGTPIDITRRISGIEGNF